MFADSADLNRHLTSNAAEPHHGHGAGVTDTAYGGRGHNQGLGGTKERITVSLDPGVAAGLKAAAEQAGAASVSKYVEGALEARMVREQWLARCMLRPGTSIRRRWPTPGVPCSASGSSSIRRHRKWPGPDLLCHSWTSPPTVPCTVGRSWWPPSNWR